MSGQQSSFSRQRATVIPYIKGGIALLLVCAWGWGLSCFSLPDFKADLVNRLRILGIRSDPLEAPAGTTVTLTSLVVDPRGNGRPIDYLWGFCPPEKGGGIGCSSIGDFSVIGISPTVSYTLPTDVTGATVIGLMVTAGTEYEVGFKRVFVFASPTPNHNPRIDAFFVGGNPVTAETHIGGDSVTITASVGPMSVEVINGIQEKMFWSWFITSGSMKDEITVGENTENVWTAGTERGSPVTATTLYVVLRDGLGGIDWTSTVLLVP